MAVIALYIFLLALMSQTISHLLGMINHGDDKSTSSREMKTKHATMDSSVS